MEFLIGQRVVTGREIAMVIHPPKQYAKDSFDDTRVWVRLVNGVEQWRSIDNVKPLPNGQL